jgi:hypothetical protein
VGLWLVLLDGINEVNAGNGNGGNGIVVPIFIATAVIL